MRHNPMKATLNGETKTIIEWSKIYGVDPNVVRCRLFQGWLLEDALTVQKKTPRVLELNGQKKTVQEWSDQIGVKVVTINSRLKNGWQIEDVLSTLVGQQRGKKHRRWRGGRITDSSGYVLVYVDENHPFVSMGVGRYNRSGGCTRYILEHRLVMAEYLGRVLTSEETVHHINGNRQDNRLENLQLRIGRHGKGQAYCCADCGSTRLNPVDL